MSAEHSEELYREAIRESYLSKIKYDHHEYRALELKLKQSFRERDEAREAGWKLAMQAVWDRLPMPAYANDPMAPREVAKLIEFVRSQKEAVK